MVLGHVADAGVAGAELGGCGIDADVADILCDADAELLLERAAEVGVGNAELCGNCADIYGLVVALREQLERAQHQRTETAGLLLAAGWRGGTRGSAAPWRLQSTRAQALARERNPSGGARWNRYNPAPHGAAPPRRGRLLDRVNA